MERALVDLDAVIGRFAALLRLGELEATERHAGLARLALKPLLEEMTALYAPLAEERGLALALTTDAPLVVDADRALMAETLGNLLDNAIKFARSRVSLRTTADAARCAIEIVADGPGGAADEREAVLRRYHRAQGASGVEGTGLGLAIVSAVVRLHGFGLTLGDAAPGLIVRIEMPARRTE